MSRGKQPRFYFSLRSPYSWLAYRTVLEEHPEVVDRLEWVPFWEPDERSAAELTERGGAFPYVAMSRAKHLYVLQDVHRLVVERGVRVAWPVDREPVWEVPHLAYYLACDAGRGHDYIALAYRARWEEGRDICDPATIAEIGTALGLDAEQLAGAVDDPELRERGVRTLLDICRHGVFGVPFFVDGRRKYWGLDRLTTFLGQLPEPVDTAVESPTVAPDAALVNTSDGGHAGGCG